MSECWMSEHKDGGKFAPRGRRAQAASLPLTPLTAGFHVRGVSINGMTDFTVTSIVFIDHFVVKSKPEHSGFIKTNRYLWDCYNSGHIIDSIASKIIKVYFSHFPVIQQRRITPVQSCCRWCPDVLVSLREEVHSCRSLIGSLLEKPPIYSPPFLMFSSNNLFKVWFQTMLWNIVFYFFLDQKLWLCFTQNHWECVRDRSNLEQKTV